VYTEVSLLSLKETDQNLEVFQRVKKEWLQKFVESFLIQQFCLSVYFHLPDMK
jgi:hypothetical protein